MGFPIHSGHESDGILRSRFSLYNPSDYKLGVLLGGGARLWIMLLGLAIVPVSLQSFAMIGDIGETKAKMEETKGEVKGEMGRKGFQGRGQGETQEKVTFILKGARTWK